MHVVLWPPALQTITKVSKMLCSYKDLDPRGYTHVYDISKTALSIQATLHVEHPWARGTHDELTRSHDQDGRYVYKG